MPYAIETFKLSKSFGPRRAVHDLSLKVREGSVTGFLGPNGAGKTTSIRMLLGLLVPTSGEISIFGKPMPAARREIASHVGSMVETASHYDHLTGYENLRVTAFVLALKRAEIERVLELVGLSDCGHWRVAEYSLGMRQRLGIARALLGRPRMLILDEPTNGLDPDGIVEMRHFIRSLAQRERVTILLSSHLLAEVEHTVSDVALLWRGALVAQAPLAELLASQRRTIEVAVSDCGRAKEIVASMGFAAEKMASGVLAVASSDPSESAAINETLVTNGIAVHALHRRTGSLEMAYQDLVQARARELSE